MRMLLTACVATLVACGDDGTSGDAEDNGGSSATDSSRTTDGGGFSSDGGGSTGSGASTAPGSGSGSDTDVEPHWEARADLLEPRQEIGVTALDGKLYVVGGFELNGAGQSTMVAAVDAYDPAADAWETLAEFPEPMHHANLAALDGELYVAGYLVSGFAERGDMYIYDPAADSWRAGTAMPGGTERGASGVAVVGDRMWVIGGLRGSQSVADVWAYDVGDDEWVVGPPLSGGRDHMVVGAIDGLIYMAGGRGGGIAGHTDALEILDPAAGTWESGASMPTSRGGMAGAVMGGRFFVTGGEGNTASPAGVFDEHEVYDPVSDSWEQLAPMITPRHGMGAAAIGSVLYVPGGAVEEAFGLGPPVHEAWVTGG